MTVTVFIWLFQARSSFFSVVSWTLWAMSSVWFAYRPLQSIAYPLCRSIWRLGDCCVLFGEGKDKLLYKVFSVKNESQFSRKIASRSLLNDLSYV